MSFEKINFKFWGPSEWANEKIDPQRFPSSCDIAKNSTQITLNSDAIGLLNLWPKYAVNANNGHVPFRPINVSLHHITDSVLLWR